MSEYQTLRDHDGNEEHDQLQQPADWRDNMSQFGKKFGEQLGAVGGKLTEQVNVVGEKMKDLFATPTLGEKMVEDATNDVLIGPDWSKNLAICDMVNAGRIPGVDVVRGVKKRLALKNGNVQLLALALLETALKNCSSLFSDVASEKVLDVMVRIVDDPTTPSGLREKCLKLIEAWGEATEELRYLPVFEETYKSLKTRGIVFPPRDPESLVPIFTPAQTVPTAGAPPTGAAGGAVPAAVHAAGSIPTAAGQPSYYAPFPVDVGGAAGVFAYGQDGAGVRVTDTPQGRVVVLDSKEILSVARNSTELLNTVLTSAPPEEVLKDEVTMSLAAQCRSSKRSVQQLVENESSNETLLFEALTVNDELDKVLDKLAELQKQVEPPPAAAAAGAPAPTAATPTVPSAAQPSDQLPGLLAPPHALPLSGAPPPVTSFAVPSMDHEADGGEALVRKRVGAADGGAAPASDDEKALAELDAMVFGKAPAPAGQPVPSVASTSAAAGSDETKNKEDDLIVF